MKPKIIAPSILSADFANLAQDIARVTVAGADWLHVDVMDGHFVPNLTIGPPVVGAIKKVSTIPLDVHLMISKPEDYIGQFLEAGSDILTTHIEVLREPSKTFAVIRERGAKAGVTLRPGTPLDRIIPYLSEVDLVLVMTVEPGFGGQKLMIDQIGKITELARLRAENKFHFLIEVDGGINDDTIASCEEADAFVSGNFIFKSDPKSAIAQLRKRLAKNS